MRAIHRCIKAFSLVVALAALPQAGRAQILVNVDFNVGNTVTFMDKLGGSAASPAPGSGAYWNGVSVTGGTQFSPGSYTSNGTLLASDGVTATSVGFSLTFSGAYQEMRFPGNANYTTSLLDDYAYATGTQTFTLTGLAANTQYDLYVFGINTQYGSDRTTFSANSTYSGSGIGVAKTIINAGNNTSFVLGQTYNAFTYATSSSLKSDGSGTIVLSWYNDGASEGAFNGFQLSASPVPEPSAYAMLGLGILFCAVVTRRRRKDHTSPCGI
ncbi:MAG: PEP-CTERM sorting domain-containing protein [Candidatus Methylacidiphilales bacterium]|nr:PEP-CTERM sorting domain-containing protein [Candidatus Methylacidiphilales bacterium]